MKNCAIILIVFLIPFVSYSQWYDLPNVPHGRCYAIDAVDSLIATGAYRSNSSFIPDSLYMTTDGGSNWFAIPLPSSLEVGDSPIDISIKDANQIWFCSGNGKIFKTTNAGVNWQLQFYDTLLTKSMNYLEMFNEMNGMAMGDAPAGDKPALFLKTTNGGEDWISQNQTELLGLHSGDIWRRVNFANIDVGYFYNYQAFPPTIYKTTDSGASWVVINDTTWLMVLKGYNDNIFIAEAANNPPYGTIHRSIDGGETWESQQWNFLDWALDIEFIPGNPSKVWCGSNSLAFSNDTGKTWVEEFYLESNAIYDMVFTDENSGWIYAGGGGTLTHMYRTTNGGHGGIVSVEETGQNLNPAEFKLEQNYPNPFNPSTKIRFVIPNEVRNLKDFSSQTPRNDNSLVTLKVYDILGNEIATLVNEELSPGEYEIEFQSKQLTSGIYFYTLRAGDPSTNSGQGFIQTKKMMLIR